MSDHPATRTTDKSAIEQRYRTLVRDDREQRHVVLRAVSERTRPLFAALEAECKQTGHKWKFDHWNWDQSYAWDKCVWCGASEGADRHERP